MSGTKIEESYLGNIKTYLFIPPCSMYGVARILKPNKQQRYTVTGESNVSLKFLVLEGVITPRLWYKKKQQKPLISKFCEKLQSCAFMWFIACQAGPCELHLPCSSHSKKWVAEEYIKYLQVNDRHVDRCMLSHKQKQGLTVS